MFFYFIPLIQNIYSYDYMFTLPFFCCMFSYRAIVLRALPNLEMLDNVSVTPEELADAIKGGQIVQSQEEIYEDAYLNDPSQQQSQQAQYQQQQQQQPPSQQQYRQTSPVREVCIFISITIAIKWNPYFFKLVILGLCAINIDEQKKTIYFFNHYWQIQ